MKRITGRSDYVELETALNQWKILHLEQKGKEAYQLYSKSMFDHIVQKVVHNSIHYADKYKYLISLAGFSPEPLILSILSLRPEKVFFLNTPDTNHILDKIVDYCELKPSEYLRREVSSSDTAEVYRQINEFVDGHDPGEFAIDITGGKKAMVGGAAQAGALLGCAVLYVDFAEYLPELRKPMPGTEYLNFLDNPYEIFGDIELREALVHYAKGNYAAGEEIVGRLRSKTPDAHKFEILLNVIQMQHQWENYQFEKAIRNGEQALAKIKQYRMLNRLRESVQRKIDLIRKLTDAQEQRWLVVNHYFNARNWAARTNYDFAVLLLYRTLEMAFALHLKNRYQLDDSSPDYSAHENLLEKYRELAIDLFRVPDVRQINLPMKIGFMGGAVLLAALQDELVQGINLEDLKRLSDQRNQGVLAHGTKSNTKKQFEKMDLVFREILNRFCRIYFDNRTLDNLAVHFIKINLTEKDAE